MQNEDDKYYYPPNDDKWEGIDIISDVQTDFAA
jgi:hypothetical protein